MIFVHALLDRTVLAGHHCRRHRDSPHAPLPQTSLVTANILSCLRPPPWGWPSFPPIEFDECVYQMDQSISCSNSQQNHCRIPLEEQSLSQESCNHADQYPVSNNVKNVESSVGSHHASLPMTIEPTITAVQDNAVPLSGKPYFTCIVSKSQIQSPFQLAVPRKFCSGLPSESIPVSLSCGGRTWEMRYCGNSSLKRFDHGWNKFAIDNNLKVGDGCVFELMDGKNMKFQVRILRGDVPTAVVYRRGGQSSDSPIMID